jgi:hypothetical protein
MARSRTQRGALSMGQLARRWGLGVDRIKRLIESGLLPGSFKVPSAGKYGEAIRVPLSTVLKAEEDWNVADHPQDRIQRLTRRSRGRRSHEFVHLPELSSERGAGYREDDQR